ncbi:MAG: calcineurin-like phosphoesterase family protein [Gemmatimonadaceae bacterium]|jgi:hypothetical protein|nr:calcineurin-like phosphoesterase family protein [Gemmatimonadaceae bacterium]
MNRRHFVQAASATAGTLVLPRLARAEQIVREPYAPHRERTGPEDVVRVRGRVHAAGRGLAGVRVSDGRSVVVTARDGRYTLLARRSQPFVCITTPRGYALPAQQGLARAYAPLGPSAEQVHDFALTPLAVADEQHALLLLADPQTQTRADTQRLHDQTVPDVIETVRALGDQPIVGVGCGDLMFDDLTLFPDWERAVQRMGVPFVSVVGNHDLDMRSVDTDEDSVATFRRRFGPTYWSFDRGAVHYVVLEDVFWYGDGYLGYLTTEQLEWLRADLAFQAPGSPVVVLLHIPPRSTLNRRNGLPIGTNNDIVNREALYRALEGFQAHVLSGHIHEQEHLREGNIMQHVHGAVCGGWWTGPINYDGAPNGYGVYQVRGEELRWRYKGTGLSASTQMRLYPAGSDPSAPDLYIANVWDWAPGWRVTWFEDGQPRGTMARRPGRDPMAVQLYNGPDLPARHGWVDPVVTEHLFTAPATAGARELRVEAVTPWGETFTETLRVGA